MNDSKYKAAQGNNGNCFATFDLGLAAALVGSGHELVELVQKDHRAQFCFTRTKQLARDVEGYWGDFLTVSARTYFDNLKMLKTRIYAN